MVAGYWKGIVISVLLVGSIIYLLRGKKEVYNDDKVVEMLLKAEDQIYKVDQRIPFIRQESPDNSSIKWFYKTIIEADKGQFSLVKLTDAEIEYVIEKFQKHLKKYNNDVLFEDVRNAAVKLKNYREKMYEVELLQNTIERNNCDLQELGSIKFTELQSSNDKNVFRSNFQDKLEKLRNLHMMKRNFSIDSRAKLEDMERNFNEGFANTTEDEFDGLKNSSIKALSEFVVHAKSKLQDSQNIITKYLNDTRTKENLDELVLKFRIAIVKVFQKITAEYLKQADNA